MKSRRLAPGWIAAVFAALSAAGGCNLPEGCARSPARGALEAGPEFALKDLSGKVVRLAELKGKVVLLDFWATWCGPCEETIPHLEALHRARGPEGLEVVGVSVDDVPEDVAPFVRDHKMTYRVLLDPEHEAMGSYGVSSVPTTVLLDRQGRIVKRWLGFDDEIRAELEADIAGLLARQP